MRKRRFYMNERLCVEEHLFRADVEERLFRAASACAFDCGLQPRPALKGIHPPAVAAMNGRSSTLTQALVLRARRNTRQEETQVRHRFVVPTLVSPTPGETKKWGSLSFGNLTRPHRGRLIWPHLRHKNPFPPAC